MSKRLFSGEVLKCYNLGPIFLSFLTASLLRHLYYLIPSAYYLLLTSFLTYL